MHHGCLDVWRKILPVLLGEPCANVVDQLGQLLGEASLWAPSTCLPSA